MWWSIVSNKIDFKLSDSNKKILNMNFAVEIIRNLLFVNEVITSEEFQNVIKCANRSVK